MTDIKRVFISTGPDRVQEGFYTLDGDKITMVYANGEPVMMDEGEPVTATAAPHMIEPIARALTKKIRKWAIGDSVPGFGRGESIDGRTDRTSALTYEREAFV